MPVAIRNQQQRAGTVVEHGAEAHALVHRVPRLRFVDDLLAHRDEVPLRKRLPARYVRRIGEDHAAHAHAERRLLPFSRLLPLKDEDHAVIQHAQRGHTVPGPSPRQPRSRRLQAIGPLPRYTPGLRRRATREARQAHELDPTGRDRVVHRKLVLVARPHVVPVRMDRQGLKPPVLPHPQIDGG